MNKHIKRVTIIALFSALVLVASKIEFRIYDTRLHFGNTMCLLSGYVLNPLGAGLASGIGSLFFDILFYPNSFGVDFLITFINKFVMGFICSLVFNMLIKTKFDKTLSLVISGILGQLAYIILYIGKTFIERYYFVGIKQSSVLIPILLIRLGTSTINAIFAVTVSTILYKSLEKYIIPLDIK